MTTATNFSRHLRRARTGLMSTGILLLLQAIVTALLPLPLMVLIDGLLVPLTSIGADTSKVSAWLQSLQTSVPADQALIFAAGLLLGLTALSALLEFAERVAVTRVAFDIVNTLREELLGRLLTRRQGYLDRKRKSDLIARVSTDAGSLEYLIGSGLATVARAIPTMIFLFALLFMLKPSLALLSLAALPLSYYLTLYFSRAGRANLAKLRAETQHFETEAVRMLAAGPVVKSLTLEDFALRALHTRSEEIGAHILNLRRTEGALVATLSGARQFLRAALLLLGGILCVKGQMGIGALAVFIVSVGPLSRAVNAIAQFVSDVGRAETSLERIEALFRETENEGETQGSQAFISLPFPDATTLHFEDVSFFYPNSPLLLEKFTASFEAGELIALTGPSGSGRTSFGRLINRLVDPSSGRIALGRTDIKRFRLEVLRTYVTIVDHEPFFVPGTVAENLLLGGEEYEAEVRDQELSQALHAANAYDFVQALPEKLDTVIGEGGYELSASQLRRLSLARAFMRTQSQIFVLDEPTTGLDPDSAAAVVASIHKLAERGAVVFWITNRLEEIPQADRVALFSRNANPRLGTHEELLGQDPIYRSYFHPVEPPRANRDRFSRRDRET